MRVAGRQNTAVFKTQDDDTPARIGKFAVVDYFIYFLRQRGIFRLCGNFQFFWQLDIAGRQIDPDVGPIFRNRR